MSIQSKENVNKNTKIYPLLPLLSPAPSLNSLVIATNQMVNLDICVLNWETSHLSKSSLTLITTSTCRSLEMTTYFLEIPCLQRVKTTKTPARASITKFIDVNKEYGSSLSRKKITLVARPLVSMNITHAS